MPCFMQKKLAKLQGKFKIKNQSCQMIKIKVKNWTLQICSKICKSNNKKEVSNKSLSNKVFKKISKKIIKIWMMLNRKMSKQKLIKNLTI